MFAEHLVFGCDILHLSLSEALDKTLLNEYRPKPMSLLLYFILFFKQLQNFLQHFKTYISPHLALISAHKIKFEIST